MAKTFSRQGGYLKFEDTSYPLIKTYNFNTLEYRISGDNIVFPDAMTIAYNDAELTNVFASVEEFSDQIASWKGESQTGGKPAEEAGFLTTATLTNGSTYNSPTISVEGFTQVQTEVNASHDGSMTFEFYSDAGATDQVRSLTVPYTAANGFQLFGAPAFTNYVKYSFTNNSGSDQTDFYFTTKTLSTGLSPQTLRVDAFLSPAMMSNVSRSVSVGENPNGVYTNLPSSGIDDNNTTSTPLGISGNFTGAWTNVSLFAEIKCAVVSDVESVNCFLQLSADGVNVDTSLSLPPQLIAGKYRFIHSLNPSLPYFRVVYDNGAVAQSEFVLTTQLLVQTGNGFVSRATQTLDRFADVKLTRSVNDPIFDRNNDLINYQEAKRKFGANEAVGNGAYEDIWAEGGTFPLLETATTVKVQAGGNVNDTAAGTGARTITVQGLDENWNEAEEDLTLAGASASASTTTTFIRINRVFVKTVGAYGGSNTGIIRIEDTAATVGVLAHIPAELGTTFQSIYAVPANKTAYITEIKTSVGESDSADVRMWRVQDGSLTFPVKKYESTVEDFSGYQPDKLETYLKFTEKETIGFDAIRITGQGTARISVEFDFILLDNM
jgi:hypothetical protein